MGGGEPNLISKTGQALCDHDVRAAGVGKNDALRQAGEVFEKEGECKNPLMAACDLQRPAAVEQLKTLGGQIGVPVFATAGGTRPGKGG